MTDELFADPRTGVRAEDCYWYHVMDVPGLGVVGGDWDLRGREDAYLGGVELAGRRVLEIGPGNGFLTFHMESRGAEVVAVELAPHAQWDIVPHAELDLEQIRADRLAIMERLRNGFWFAHERLGSRARVHYGSVYDLPDELGRFDVAVLGSVLLHLRDPLRALEQCARLADTLVIVDLHVPELSGPEMRLMPARGSDNWHSWWRFSVDLITEYAGVLGHGHAATSVHEQSHVHDGRVYPMPLFTVVAARDPLPTSSSGA